MNYQKIHNQIITKAQNRNLDNVYYEEHHIIPVSMNGTNDKNNLVKLTAKEHFVIHHLLWKIHRNREMTKAFMLMCSVRRGGKKFKINAKGYQKLKEEFSNVQSEAIKSRPGNNLGRKLSKEWKDNISKGQKGHGRGNGGSRGFTGKHWSEEHKKAISERMKGCSHHSVPHSEETKKKMSENRKGKPKQPWSEERKAARRELLAIKFSQKEKHTI